jgi:hypothetical protein
MMTDPYWDELGIAWSAITPGTDAIPPRLQVSLQRQSMLIATCLVTGLLLGVAGVLLGVFTLWSGWASGTWNFVTRGGGVMAISSILLVAALGLLPVRAGDQARALPDVIDLTIARAERLLMAIRLGFLACAVAAVLGLVGTAIRSYSGKPPAMSPILDLAVVAILAVGLFLYGRHLRAHLAKLQYLRKALAVSGT